MPDNPALMIVELGLDASNDDIVEKMRTMRQARLDRTCSHVACLIRGFDDDSRELFDIPEVRAFCRRLMTLGFASYLEGATTLAGSAPDSLRQAWGAFEVWMTAEGRFGPNLAKRMNRDRKYAKTVLDEWKAMLGQQNQVADARFGQDRPAAE